MLKAYISLEGKDMQTNKCDQQDENYNRAIVKCYRNKNKRYEVKLQKEEALCYSLTSPWVT